MRGGRIDRAALMKEDPLIQRNQQIIGSMYMFFYDPKHKETLPYYDTFPLVIVLSEAPGGFLGLNLHYLPPLLRAKFLDALLDTLNNQKYDKTTKFRATYDLMKSASKMKYFKPCIKHYLSSHVKSKFTMIPPPEFEIAVFLPTANFKAGNKAYSANAVYKDSRGML